MAFRKFNRVGLPGEHAYTRGTDGENLLEGGGGGRLVQTRNAQWCSRGWAAAVVAAIAIAVTALIVGSVALRNTDQGLIGKIATLLVGDFIATGNGNITGSLIVGHGITGKRDASTMAVDVAGASNFGGDVSAQATLTVGDKAILIARNGRRRAAEKGEIVPRGRTKASCKPEKLTVLGSQSVCGDISIAGTSNLNTTNVNGTITATSVVTTTVTVTNLNVTGSITVPTVPKTIGDLLLNSQNDFDKTYYDAINRMNLFYDQTFGWKMLNDDTSINFGNGFTFIRPSPSWAALREEMFHVKFVKNDRLHSSLRADLVNKYGEAGRASTSEFDYAIGTNIGDIFFGCCGGITPLAQRIETIQEHHLWLYTILPGKWTPTMLRAKALSNNPYIDNLLSVFDPPSDPSFETNTLVVKFIGNLLLIGPKSIAGVDNTNFFLPIYSFDLEALAAASITDFAITKNSVLYTAKDPQRRNQFGLLNGYQPPTLYGTFRERTLKCEGARIASGVTFLNPTYLKAKYPTGPSPTYTYSASVNLDSVVLRGFPEGNDASDNNAFGSQLYSQGIVVDETGNRGGNGEYEYYDRNAVRVETATVGSVSKNAIVIKARHFSTQYVPSANRLYSQRIAAPGEVLPAYVDQYGQFNGVDPYQYQFQYTSGRVHGDHMFKHGRFSAKVRFSTNPGSFSALWFQGATNPSLAATSTHFTSKFNAARLAQLNLTLSSYDYIDTNTYLCYGLKNYVLTHTTTGIRYSIGNVLSANTPLKKFDGYRRVYFNDTSVNVGYRFGDVGGLVSCDNVGFSAPGDYSGIHYELFIHVGDNSANPVLTHAYHFDQVLSVGWPDCAELDVLETFIGKDFSLPAGPASGITNSFEYDTLSVGSTQIRNPYIPWYNFGNNGQAGPNFHISSAFLSTLSNSEASGQTASITGNMTKWYNVQVLRDTNSFEIIVDGRSMIKRLRTDYISTDQVSNLFDAPMSWLFNVAIGSNQYNSGAELQATWPEMDRGAFRSELTDVTIESNEPIQRTVDVLSDLIHAGKKRADYSHSVSADMAAMHSIPLNKMLSAKYYNTTK